MFEDKKSERFGFKGNFQCFLNNNRNVMLDRKIIIVFRFVIFFKDIKLSSVIYFYSQMIKVYCYKVGFYVNGNCDWWFL